MRNRPLHSTMTLSAIVLLALVITWWLAPVPLAGQEGGALYGGPMKPVAGCPGESVKFSPCGAAKAKGYNPPRTPRGEPDLQGHWGAPTVTGGQSIVENPGDGGLFYRATRGIIIDPPGGQVPYNEAAAAKYKDRRDREPNPPSVDYIDPNARCVGYGVPRQMYGVGGLQIIQAPPYVVLLNEWSHIYRVIPTDGSPHPSKRVKLYMADSRGRWEGTTLVVDTTNFNAIPWLDSMGNFISQNTRIVERMTPVDPDTLLYEATIEDSTIYARPWKIAFPLVRNTQQGYEIMEYACHEGERNFERHLPPGIEKK